jgi:hypothetical protein
MITRRHCYVCSTSGAGSPFRGDVRRWRLMMEPNRSRGGRWRMVVTGGTLVAITGRLNDGALRPRQQLHRRFSTTTAVAVAAAAAATVPLCWRRSPSTAFYDDDDDDAATALKQLIWM